MKILERATRWIGTGILLQGFSNLRPTFEIFSTNYTFMYVYVHIYISNVSRAFRRDSRNSGRFVNRVREQR